MFNRQPYNRGKFNSPSGQSTSNSGISILKLAGNEVKPRQDMTSFGTTAMVLRTLNDAINIKSSSAIANLMMDGKGTQTKIYYGIANTKYCPNMPPKNSDGSATLILDNKVSPTKIYYGMLDISNIQLQTKGEHTLAGEETIKLSGLILKPGDEIVIDTCEMTVSVNGQNMMKFVSNDSEFFSLLPGDNEIIYTDGVTTRKVSIDILWKDRWV